RVPAGAARQPLVGVLEAIGEERSIRESGQGVVNRLVFELTLQPHAVGDVTGANDHRGCTVEDRPASVDLDIEEVAALGRVADALEVPRPPARGGGFVAKEIALLGGAYPHKCEPQESP